MDELLKKLAVQAKQEGREHLRLLVMSLNGVAAIHILEKKVCAFKHTIILVQRFVQLQLCSEQSALAVAMKTDSPLCGSSVKRLLLDIQ